MGVKSTVTLTRAQAIERMIDLQMPMARQQLHSVYDRFSDKQLESILEMVNDDARGGEGFENYTIIGDDQ
jgi:hypothetical protein